MTRVGRRAHHEVAQRRSGNLLRKQLEIFSCQLAIALANFFATLVDQLVEQVVSLDANPFATRHVESLVFGTFR